jgi:hypothetical protein
MVVFGGRFAASPPRPSNGSSTDVIAPACAAAVFLCTVAVCALFVPRNGTGDELGLINPMYMLLRTGHMTYPVHYMFDRMVVHPPTHYAAVAMFARLGLPLYYAEALPTLLAAIGFAVVVSRSRLEPAFKFALFVGATMPLTFAIRQLTALEWFGMRPEGELLFWWLAGLVALEQARRTAWSPRWSAAGSLMLAYASSLHYYAAPALAGVIVYALAAARSDDGWRFGSRAVLSIVVPAGIVFGVFALVFVLPNLTAIREFVAEKAGSPDARAGWTAHFDVYALAHGSSSLASNLMSALDDIRVPAALLVLALLLPTARTRVFALAAAPVPLTVLFATAKHAYYLGHELSLLVTAIVLWLLRGAAWLSEHLPRRAAPVAFDLAAIVLLGVVITRSPVFSIAEISMQPRVHESEQARAAGQAMLGTNAIVGGSTASWYASGASGYYGIDPDLLFARLGSLDVRTYAQRFDALVQSPQMSDYTYNDRGANLASWYADGTLDLRGIYIAESNPVLSYWLLSGRHERPEVFFKRGEWLFHGIPSDNGAHVFATLRCREEPHDTGLLTKTMMKLPPPGGGAVVLAGLDTVATMRAFIGRHPECTARDAQNVTLSWVRAGSLGRGLFDDPPMRFFRSLDQVPPRSSPGKAGLSASSPSHE